MDNKGFSSCDSTRIKEAVCIDTNRVYDSCADKDCLSDLRLIFTDRAQCVVDRATSVRCRSAEVINATINVESVPFNRGCYSVDITYYFKVTIDVCTAPCAAPETVCGLTTFSKKCILYGSEGNVKVFTSEYSSNECGCDRPAGFNSTAPRAKVQIVEPICLEAKLCTPNDCLECIPENGIPACICALFDGQFQPQSRENAVKVSLGIFTIVQLERDVQMLIPAYDFCVPTKECCMDTMDPCDTFRKIHFPIEEFFPPNCKNDKN